MLRYKYFRSSGRHLRFRNCGYINQHSWEQKVLMHSLFCVLQVFLVEQYAIGRLLHAVLWWKHEFTKMLSRIDSYIIILHIIFSRRFSPLHAFIIWLGIHESISVKCIPKKVKCQKPIWVPEPHWEADVRCGYIAINHNVRHGTVISVLQPSRYLECVCIYSPIRNTTGVRTRRPLTLQLNTNIKKKKKVET